MATKYATNAYVQGEWPDDDNIVEAVLLRPLPVGIRIRLIRVSGSDGQPSVESYFKHDDGRPAEGPADAGATETGDDDGGRAGGSNIESGDRGASLEAAPGAAAAPAAPRRSRFIFW